MMPHDLRRPRLHRGFSAFHRFVSVLTFSWVIFSPGFIDHAAAQAWKAEEVQEDGILHVKNPATPRDGVHSIRLRELWRLGGDSEDDDQFFGVIGQIAMDESGNVYLLDSQLSEVRVFSPEGEYLATLGREGEGPGEFRRPEDLFLLPNGDLAVIQSRPGKIVLLDQAGEPAGELPVRLTEEGNFAMFTAGRPAGEDIVLYASQGKFREGSGEFTSSLVRVAPDGSPKARYAETTIEFDFANRVIDERNRRDNLIVWSSDAEGRIFSSEVFDRYHIDVWNPDGTMNRVIERAFETRKRSPAEFKKQEQLQRPRGRWARNATYKVSPTDRDILEIFTRKNGDLWVLSSSGGLEVMDGTLAVFDVFDEDGRFIYQARLQGNGSYEEDGFFLFEDRMFVVTGLRDAVMAMRGGGGEDDEAYDYEGEPEPLAIICYALEPVVAGAGP